MTRQMGGESRRRSRRWLVVLGLVIAMMMSLFLAAKTSGWTLRPDSAKDGGRLYAANCVSCHGESGNRVPAVPLASRAYLDQLGDPGLVAAVSKGRNSMPAFEKSVGGQLSTQQVEAIVLYLRAPEGPAAKVATPIPGNGHDLYLENCARCHGLDGAKVPQVRIGSDEFVNSRGESALTKVILTGQGQMPGFANTLQSSQVKDVLNYLRSLGPAGSPSPSTPTQAGSKIRIPHSVTDRTNSCTVCHGPNGIMPFPADHAGRTNRACLTCHTGSSSQQAAYVPMMPHDLQGREDCLACHGPKAMLPVPLDHEGRTKDTCLGCHKASPPVAQGSIPKTPHEIDGRTDCLGCHKSGFLTGMPADHTGRPSDQCQTCHKQGPTGASKPAPQVPHETERAGDCLKCHAAKTRPAS